MDSKRTRLFPTRHSRRRGRDGRRGPNFIARLGEVPRPPTIEGQYRCTRRLRFTATSAFSATISYADIISAFGLVATSATTGYPLGTAVRVIALEAWGTSSSGDATVVLNWQGNAFGPNNLVQDTSNTAQYPAHIRSRPPPDSGAALFNESTSTTAIILTVPINAIIDITAEIVFAIAGYTTNSGVVTLAGATTGNFYYLPLDGIGGVLLPVLANAP